MPMPCASPRLRCAPHIYRSNRAAGDHVVTLVAARWFGARLRRLTFRCESIDRSWYRGDRLLVRVDAHVRRYYTIARIDHRTREFDVLAVAHPHGVGGHWVRDIAPRDTTVVFGPKPDLDVRIDDARTLVLLGDETTLGLFEAVRSARRGGLVVSGAIEHHADLTLGPEVGSALEGLDPLPRDPDAPGASLHAWVRSHMRPRPHTVFFVGGHGAAVRSLRLTLLGMGVRGSAIRSRAYWGRPG